MGDRAFHDNCEAKRVLVTGGCGFIASHLVEHLHRKTNWDIVVVDKLTYASNGMSRLRENGMLDSRRVTVYTFDLAHPFSEGIKQELGDINIIIHTAADTHIPYSIDNPVDVIQNNVMGTVHLLEYARELHNLTHFITFSTDEVYGHAEEGVDYIETDRHQPTNPYSSSKSAAEQICVGYKSVYQIPLIIVNCMNAIGEMQHPEKYVPMCIKNILEGNTIQVHADPTLTKPGSRFYIHSRNIADAVLFLVENGTIGETYHITGEREVDNLEIAQMIADIMKLPLKYEMVDFHSANHGHDSRYSLSGKKLEKLGWKPPVTFSDSLRKTIEWTLNHEHWLKI